MDAASRATEPETLFARERSAGRRLPYSHHVNDRVVELRDGNLMLVIRLGGLLFETADSAELNYRKGLRDAMLRAIGSSRFAIYHHVLRMRVEPLGGGTFPDAFSAALDETWRRRMASRKLYANDLFLTIVRRPLQGRTGIGERLARRFGRATSRAAADAQRAIEVRALEAAGDQLLAALASYTPRLLSAYDTPNGPCSEVLEFLSALYNADLSPVRLPASDAGEYLPYR
ncbi:MAG: VirB4 family type IV secretion/conjugal transfer ATPase, partial [Novosphingobium sp.]|nr:VirB4 family type IV secretion/conjugal transfer ATPase [Novosphingobium sp.]